MSCSAAHDDLCCDLLLGICLSHDVATVRLLVVVVVQRFGGQGQGVCLFALP